MMVIGDWADFLSHNIGAGAMLWYAWGGGVRSVLDGVTRIAAPIIVEGRIEPGQALSFGVASDEAKPKLTLVP